jgi:hypothetical protein
VSLLDWFHTVGSAVALGIGAFTIYDRFLRYRPLLSITARLEGANPWAYLRVKNVAPFDIFIEGIEIQPPAFGTSADTHHRALIETITGTKTTAILEPGGEILLHIVKFDVEHRSIAEDDVITVRAPWRNSAAPWLKPRAAVLRTSIRDITERERAAVMAGRRV